MFHQLARCSFLFSALTFVIVSQTCGEVLSQEPATEPQAQAPSPEAKLPEPATATKAPESPPALHSRIDALLKQSQFGPVAEVAEDSTFARRVYLDLIGRIPTVEELKAFLSNSAPEKRQLLVDELLARPDFNRHMAVTFDLMLMERRGGKHVKPDEFRQYLEESFQQNKSYLQLSKEILAADGTAEKNRPAAAFYLERDVAPDLLTREIGRVFFGVDLQCAQCHNHPNIDDYHQEDYYGLQAFIVRASLFQPDKKKPAVIAENAVGEASFESVFTSRASMTGPRVLGGEELVEVSLKPGERYQVAPAKNVRPIPKESRFEKLAEMTTAQPSAAFNRNIANRLWAHMLGRGLVHPVDLHHSGNPPSHPELLNLISEDFVARKYDVKSYLREIALSEVYQRSSRLQVSAASLEETRKQVAALEAKAEEEFDKSYKADELVETATQKLDAAFAEMKPFQAEIEKTHKAIEGAMKVRDAAIAKVDPAKKATAEKVRLHQLLVNAHQRVKIASEALKEDKELAATVTVVQNKETAMAAEVEKLKAAEAAAVAALTTAEEALKATHVASDAAVAAAVPIEEKVRTLRTEQIATRKVAADHREAAALATNKANELKSLIEYGELQQKIAALQKEIPIAKTALQSNTAQMPTLEKALLEKTSAMTAAQQATAAAQKVVQESETVLQKHQATEALLKDSLNKLVEAAKNLEGENPLAAAKTEIQTSLTTTEAAVKSMQAQVAQQKNDLTAKTATVATATTELKVADDALKAQQQLVKKLEAELASKESELQKSQASLEAMEGKIVTQSSKRMNASGLSQLTPEQLGWSVLVATGQRDRVRVAEAAKLNKATPLTEADLKDPAKVAAREAEIDTATYATLSKNVATFVKLFGATAGQPQNDFFATAEQALFFANGNELSAWLAPSGGNLTDRLIKNEDPKSLAQELYLSVFCRPPTELEIKDVTDYLNARTDAKPAAVQELAWALITSAEFRFQY
ncbi:DUF1549 domain-containing protein [Thalassoglobus sp.]|uniref:DUF1549 domain-containing protein n=1 Tax=Thalassoglobus sp. TaxID=2795869 RepID=UPI003AA8237F